MPVFENFAGRVFARLTVLRRAPNIKRQTAWHVRCACTKEFIVRSNALKTGNTTSCGCYQKELIAAVGVANGTHRLRHTAEYRAWAGLRDRCNRLSHKNRKRYGGRGIKCCARWDSFENFLADMGARPSPKHELDRIDVHGDYEPGNCRWATRKQQMNNTTANRFIEYSGKRLTIAQRAEIAGMKAPTLRGRIERGWPVAEALWAPEVERSIWRQLARAKIQGSA